MLLKKLTLIDFGCHKRLELSDLGRLVVLVGENDAGKSLVLRALNDLTRPTRFDPSLACQNGEAQSSEYEISGEFAIEADDNVPSEFRFGKQLDRVFIRKTFSAAGVRSFAMSQLPEDTDLANFARLDRKKQFALLTRFGETPANRGEDRILQVSEILKAPGTRFVEGQQELSDREVENLLPRVEAVAAGEFRDAQTILTRILRSVVREIVYEDANAPVPAERTEIQALRREIETRLNERLAVVSEYVRSHQPQVCRMLATPIVQFDGVLSRVDIQLEMDGNVRPLAGFGDGTNKRVWMGVLQWEESLAGRLAAGSLIRTYDEPDTSLHYAAQHQLLRGILSRSEPSKKTQCVIATHSLALVDRVPASSIRLIEVLGGGERRVRSLQSDAEEAVASVLRDVGRAMGLSNSALLYERAFLIVEGESEAAALPVLHRTLFGTSLTDDGVVLVNLHGCGAWKSIFELIMANRHELCRLLLDEDCRWPGSTANLKQSTLEELNLPSDFLENQVTFVGVKEYEDAFTNDVIICALETGFPREDGVRWSAHHIEDARSKDKFSEALVDVVRRTAKRPFRNDVTKPSLALAVARACSEADIPSPVAASLRAVRALAME